MPADPKCPKCGGTGHIFIDSMNAKRCICLQRSLYARKLGMHLYRVPPAKNSPLLKKLDTNMFLMMHDDDINPHLKSAFVKLGLNAHWIYLDDSSVLQAWLGKPNSADAQNLNELMDYPFMVLRLGVVGYKNVALSGVITELLMGRLMAFKTTWIVSPRPLAADTCLEYSDELDNLLRRHFESSSWKYQKDKDHFHEERREKLNLPKKQQPQDSWEEVMVPQKPGKKKSNGTVANAKTNDILSQFKL